jgi:hypothetical protein
MIGQEAMRLVASMILSTKTPINTRENGLICETFCAEDTAAYVPVPFKLRLTNRERRALYTFRTFSSKKHGKFAIPPTTPNQKNSTAQ